MNFGEKVRYVRTLREYSLDVLSSKCGLSKTYLSEIETNKKRPSLKSLEKIAKALVADASFFMDNNATTFNEIVKVSGYDPPEDIMKFIASQDKLPYLVLAKEMSDEGLTPDQIKLMFSNIKLMMQSLNK